MQKRISKAKLTEHIQNFFIKTEKNPIALYNCFVTIHNENQCFEDRKKLRKIFDYASNPIECSAIDRYLISQDILTEDTINKWKEIYKEQYGTTQSKYRYNDINSFVILEDIMDDSYQKKDPLEWLFWLNSNYMCHTGKQKTVSFVNKWIQFVIRECQFEGLDSNDKALETKEILYLKKKF